MNNIVCPSHVVVNLILPSSSTSENDHISNNNACTLPLSQTSSGANERPRNALFSTNGAPDHFHRDVFRSLFYTMPEFKRRTPHVFNPITKTEVKWCSYCVSYKNLPSFTKDATRWDGLSYYCIPCNARRNRDTRAETASDRDNGYVYSYDTDENGRPGLPCSKCKVFKTLTEFHKCKTNRTGYQPSCKQCCSESYRRKRDKSSS